MRRWHTIVAAALFSVALPTMALAARGYTTADVNLRAGPGTGYPIVTTVPDGARINIHGCLSSEDWCDVSWHALRGWIASDYLNYFYNGSYVYLPDYFTVVNVPVVSFVLDTYWGHYYRHRSWYHRRAYWVRYWHRHRHHHRPVVRHRHHRVETRRQRQHVNRVEHRRAHQRVEHRRSRASEHVRRSHAGVRHQPSRHVQHHRAPSRHAIRPHVRHQPAVRRHAAPRRFSRPARPAHRALPHVSRPAGHARAAPPRAAPHVAAPRAHAGGGGHRARRR